MYKRQIQDFLNGFFYQRRRFCRPVLFLADRIGNYHVVGSSITVSYTHLIIKAAVTDGTFLGAVTQSPLMMGYYAIYALTAAANGQELEDCLLYTSTPFRKSQSKMIWQNSKKP